MKEFYVLIVKYNSNKIDKIYRKEIEEIEALKIHYEYLFSKAEISIKKESL